MLLDRRLKLNPTIFQTDWKNIQFTAINLVPAPVAATQNAGDARVRGFELETEFVATEHLQLTAAYSYLDAKYTRLDPALTNGTTTSLPVKLKITDNLPRSPKTKFSVGARYKQPFASGADVVGSVNYAYTAQQRGSVDGDQNIQFPSYGLLSARVEFHPANSNFEFALYGTNLLDKYYLIDGINFQSVSGTITNIPGRPREGGASVKYKF